MAFVTAAISCSCGQGTESGDCLMNELKNFLLPNDPTCIVACSGTTAKLWLCTSRFGEWQALVEMQHPESATREGDLTSDRPGRSFDSFGSGRHAMSQPQSAHEQELTRFADKVADYVNKGIASGKFRNLVLLAAPGFLGHLRDKLSTAAANATVLTAAKNITSLDVKQVRAYFQ